VINNIEDLQNYQCFLASPFVLEKQPRVLIFVDNKALAMRIAHFLDSLLPPQFQKKGVVLHYHSVMSEKYLKRSHDAFTTSTGVCQIMVATSAQSVVCFSFV
jgi:superfamily II DNA/RNA helicase